MKTWHRLGAAWMRVRGLWRRALGRDPHGSWAIVIRHSRGISTARITGNLSDAMLVARDLAKLIRLNEHSRITDYVIEPLTPANAPSRRPS